MKPNSILEDNYSIMSEGKWSILDEMRDDNSTRSSSNLSMADTVKPSYLKLTSKSISYIFPLVYFFSSFLFLFIILFVNLYKDHQIRDNFELLPLNPFPGFYTLKEIQPKIFSASILIISISGFLNVWFFCSLLLQRFSVPELSSNKLTVHLMFILGIFGNIIYIFFGFSPELLDLEYEKIKILKISLSMIIFLSFVFFNTLFAALTLMVFENFRKKIASNDQRLSRNMKIKKYVVCLSIFICLLYITAIMLNYQIKAVKAEDEEEKEEDKSYVTVLRLIQILLFMTPYILFILNAIINLTYYYDIRYVDDIINVIIDKEYFLTSEESNLLLYELPI